MTVVAFNLRPYLALLNAFAEGRLSADEFEDLYLFVFKNDRSFPPESIYNVLNSLFGEVDAYSPNEDLRGNDGVGPVELQASAANALTALHGLTTEAE